MSRRGKGKTRRYDRVDVFANLRWLRQHLEPDALVEAMPLDGDGQRSIARKARAPIEVYFDAGRLGPDRDTAKRRYDAGARLAQDHARACGVKQGESAGGGQRGMAVDPYIGKVDAVSAYLGAMEALDARQQRIAYAIVCLELPMRRAAEALRIRHQDLEGELHDALDRLANHYRL